MVIKDKNELQTQRKQKMIRSVESSFRIIVSNPYHFSPAWVGGVGRRPWNCRRESRPANIRWPSKQKGQARGLEMFFSPLIYGSPRGESHVRSSSEGQEQGVMLSLLFSLCAILLHSPFLSFCASACLPQYLFFEFLVPCSHGTALQLTEQIQPSWTKKSIW